MNYIQFYDTRMNNKRLLSYLTRPVNISKHVWKYRM